MLDMDEQLTCFDPTDLMSSFKTHKNCASCSSARMFFEPGAWRLKALQSTLGRTDRTGEITRYLNSSSSNLELVDRILDVLTDLNSMRTEMFEAFVAGTASRQVQKHMWQFLMGLATETMAEPGIAEIGREVGSGTDISCGNMVDLSKMSFRPAWASTPMLAAPTAPPPSTLPRRKATKSLFQGDKCPGAVKPDTLDGAESTVKQMVHQSSKYEGCLESLPTFCESLAASVDGGKAAPTSHASMAAVASAQLDSESLRQHASSTATVIGLEDSAQERLPSTAQLSEVRDSVCRLGRATQQLSRALEHPQHDGQQRVALNAQRAGDAAAAATNIERALTLLMARKQLG